MASLKIILTSIQGALNNRFIVRMLRDGEPMDDVQQDQIFTLSDVNEMLVVLPDGQYAYENVVARIFSDSVLSNIYEDIIIDPFIIDCGTNQTTLPSVSTSRPVVQGNTTHRTTVQNTTVVNTTVQTITIPRITTLPSTTAPVPLCNCGGIPSFAIALIQIVGFTAITETVSGQTSSGTHRISYSSCGVVRLNWILMDGLTIIRTGSFSPTSNNFLIDLSGIVPGTYNLQLSSVYFNGGGCTGTDTKPLTINAVTTTLTTTLPPGTLSAAIGVAPSYTHVIDEANSFQQDTNYLDLEIAEVNSEGRVRFRNKAPHANPDNGRSPKYCISLIGYVDSLDNRFFEIYQGFVVSYHWVDLNVPDYAWQAVGANTESFFKSYSIIHFT